MAEATDRLYKDLLKRKIPDLEQVVVVDGGEGKSLSSDESHNCFRIGRNLLRSSPTGECFNPKLFPGIELLIPDEVTEIAPDAFEGFEESIYFRDSSMIENSYGDVIDI